MCPLCGDSSHVNAGAIARFERKHPELFVVGYACRLCCHCESAVCAGDHVHVRDTTDTGVVQRVATCGDGFSLYRVQLDSGFSATFPRTKITKVFISPLRADAGTDPVADAEWLARFQCTDRHYRLYDTFSRRFQSWPSRQPHSLWRSFDRWRRYRDITRRRVVPVAIDDWAP